jgi:hypothetical protein
MSTLQHTGKERHAARRTKKSRPDGKAGVVSLPRDEWDSRHGRTWSLPTHTPGPWGIVDAESNAIDIINKGGLVVASITADEEVSPEDWTNARLMAAAPEMLEALCHVVKFADSEPDGGTTVAMHRANVERARAAISRATRGKGPP